MRGGFVHYTGGVQNCFCGVLCPIREMFIYSPISLYRKENSTKSIEYSAVESRPVLHYLLHHFGTFSNYLCLIVKFRKRPQIEYTSNLNFPSEEKTLRYPKNSNFFIYLRHFENILSFTAWNMIFSSASQR